ncbi:MAG: F0F1 ATP synthase subunit B [Candidatus Sumerlaeia bacterium]|nr:F0F1 ATP synthase subunit B [Candidatus Sumerlaeia bacterium]
MTGTTPIILLGAAAGTLTAQVVTTVIAFLMVLFVLKKFAWGPILAHLDERRDAISKQFDDLDARHKQLDGQIRDYEARLKQIDEEARQRINTAVDEGRRVAAEIEAKAKADAEAALERAKQAIRIETDKARVELRNEMVAIVIGATEKLVRQQCDGDAQRRLVQNFIAEMQDKSPR